MEDAHTVSNRNAKVQGVGIGQKHPKTNCFLMLYAHYGVPTPTCATKWKPTFAKWKSEKVGQGKWPKGAAIHPVKILQPGTKGTSELTTCWFTDAERSTTINVILDAIPLITAGKGVSYDSCHVRFCFELSCFLSYWRLGTKCQEFAAGIPFQVPPHQYMTHTFMNLSSNSNQIFLSYMALKQSCQQNRPVTLTLLHTNLEKSPSCWICWKTKPTVWFQETYHSRALNPTL